MFYVGTGIDSKYIQRAVPYLESLRRQVAGDPRIVPFVVCLGFDPVISGLTLQYPGIRFERLDPSEVAAPNANGCLQHGAFLPALSRLGLTDDDYVVFTDADIVIQRSFSDDELTGLAGRVLVGTNWHDGEMLSEEAKALHPRYPEHVLSSIFPSAHDHLCYNTGVLGMPVRFWKRVLETYIISWSMVDRLFVHYAKQQWLLSHIIQALRLPTIDHRSDLARDIHAHGHEPNVEGRLATQGVSWDGRSWNRNGKAVVFAHHLFFTSER